MLLGLIAACTMSNGSTLKALVMVAFGLVLGIVGLDLNSGVPRFTFGFLGLTEGVSLISIAMGLFGIAEIVTKLAEAKNGARAPDPEVRHVSFRDMLPRGNELRRLWGPILRGTGIGSIIGALPGSGPTVAAFMAYAMEKKVSRTPEKFGTGALEGVAAPEAANNASVQAAFIPTLSLGIPGDVVMAILLGAMIMHGIIPGPQFISAQPAMFWGLIVSFWIGNVMLLILNLPLIGLLVKIITVPARILYPVVIFFICIGSYSVANNVLDVFVTLVFGLVGYLLMRLNYNAAPVLLGFILGPMMEENLRRSLVISRGDLTVFLDRPVSVGLLLVCLLLLLMPLRKPLMRYIRMAGQR